MRLGDRYGPFAQIACTVNVTNWGWVNPLLALKRTSQLSLSLRLAFLYGPAPLISYPPPTMTLPSGQGPALTPKSNTWPPELPGITKASKFVTTRRPTPPPV